MRKLAGLRLYLVLTVAIEAIFALYFLVRHKAFAFTDIGSDTYLAFYPIQTAISRQFHALHSFTWSFDQSLGGYIAVAFDPAWLITSLFPDTWQLGLRLPLFCARLLLAGGFFYGYLKLIGFEARLAVFGALAFAFSSYGVLNGQWEISHGTEFVLLAFYLFAIEAYLRQGKRWPAVCVGALLALAHPMNPYMFALFALVYAGARFAFTREFVGTIKGFAGFAAWCAVGVLLAAPMFLPAAYYLLENPRVSGGHSKMAEVIAGLFSLNNTNMLKFQLAGLLGKDLLGTGNAYTGWQNYFEGPGFYIGLLPLLCIPQLFGRDASHRERWLGIAGLIGVAAYFVWPFLRYAVYGFGYPTYRFSTLWVSLVLLVMGLAGLRRCVQSAPWRTGVTLGALSIAILALGCLWFYPKHTNYRHVMLVLGFAAVYWAILRAAADSAWRSRMLYPLTLVFACELMLFAAPALLERDTADTTNPHSAYDDGTTGALELIRAREGDSDFYRIEKTYNSVYLDDALVQDYSGIKAYFFNASSLTRFVDRMHLQRPLEYAAYIGSAIERRAILDLVGVRYLLTHNRDLDATPGLSYVGSANGIDVYHNDNAHTFAYLLHDLVSETEADAMSMAQRDAVLSHTAIVADPPALQATLAQLDSTAQHAGATEWASLHKLNDTRLEGSVDAARAGLLLLSMPFDAGWSARLDDKEVPLMRADYGLAALPVAPGLHQLTLQYSPPGRRLGNYCALLGLLILGGFSVYRWSKTRARTTRKAQ
jgi:uncharacterized membrane protein YfhO